MINDYTIFDCDRCGKSYHSHSLVEDQFDEHLCGPCYDETASYSFERLVIAE